MLSKGSRIILDTLLPAGAHPALANGVFDTDFETFWSDFERSVPPSLRRNVAVALRAAEWIAPLLILRTPPLRMHDQPIREGALSAMASSRVYLLRQMLQLLKMVVCFCYGADRRVRDAVGYPLQHDDPRRTVSQ